MDDPKLVRLMELVAENRSLKQSLEEMQMKWEVHMTLMMEDKGLTMDAKPLGYMGGVDDGSLSVDDKKGEETKHVHAAESEKSQSASASKNKHPACIGETSEVSSTDFKCDAVYPAALSESSKNEMTQSSTVDVDGKIFSLEAENEAMKVIEIFVCARVSVRYSFCFPARVSYRHNTHAVYDVCLRYLLVSVSLSYLVALIYSDQVGKSQDSLGKCVRTTNQRRGIRYFRLTVVESQSCLSDCFLIGRGLPFSRPFSPIPSTGIPFIE